MLSLRDIQRLEGEALDTAVAQALGLRIAGRALCEYAPDDGRMGLVVPPYSDRKARSDTTFERAVYLIGESDFDYDEPEFPHVLGHPWPLLEPVPAYTHDAVAGIELIDRFKIALVYAPPQGWTAWVSGTPAPAVLGNDLLTAVSRAVVANAYGRALRGGDVHAQQ